MKILSIVLCVLVAASAAAQVKQPELTGTLSFNISSDTGRVENLSVQIGDGGTGKYKAILAGDSSLPTHAIYRPRNLKPFGGKLLLPIVAFGNGGCRNGSGEFRNFLSDIASHGYLVVAIGPASEALVGGSEGRLSQTDASQLLDGVGWAIKENSRQGSEYYQKIDITKVAVMGQSCGTRQATQVSGDPRITTTILLNGSNMLMSSAARAPAQGSAKTDTAPAQGSIASERGAYGNTGSINLTDMMAVFDKIAKRYAPYGTACSSTAFSELLSAGAAQESKPVTFHGPVAFFPGGPSDMAFSGAVSGYEALKNVPTLLAYQDVGHYPATFRQPNGGAYAVAVNAWLDWQLKGDQAASKMFAGSSCGLCKDPKWTVKIKNLPR
jgi:hypothetical protein